MSDYGENNEKLPEDLQNILVDLTSRCEKEDSWVRKQQVKLWKKNEEFWHGIQFIFWSESRQDWISPTETRWFQQEEGREEAEGPFYDFVVNIYKGHGEAIISALSAQIPSVRFPPDDAEDDDDQTTSKTYSKISDLIMKHNRFKLLFLRALFCLWNQGLVAAYHAPKADKAFGTMKIPNYKKGMTCPNCEGQKPVEHESELVEGHPCPTCGEPMEVMPILDGFTEAPKTRVIIECYGPLFVKVPYLAKDPKDIGYIGLNVDQPKPYLKSIFPHISDKIDKDDGEIGMYERQARTPSSFSSFSRVDENQDLACLRRWWLKPWQLESIPKEKEEEKKKLQKLFPNGIYVGMVGKTYAESRDEDFEKYWTIGQAGLSTYIHSDAIGQPLVPIQELTNVHVNLTEETIENGMSSIFADPGVVNFEDYSRHEARPGFLYPARRKPGETLGQAFYETNRATLSKEVQLFGKWLETAAQFVVGSFPSVYGGPAEGKSRTASEYNMSRQMALQRLSICWSFLCDWTARLMDKCVHLYVENLIEDERYTKKEDNNYVNVWIRRSELTGKVGDVEAEGAETFPISTPQKQALLMKLIELNNEFLNQAIYLPENRKLIADSLSMPEFELPGEDQRIKQSREINDMLKGLPVPIDPEVDEHSIHVETLRHYMVGIGMDLKKTNPISYGFMREHLMAHLQAMQGNQSQKPQEQPQNNVAPINAG